MMHAPRGETVPAEPSSENEELVDRLVASYAAGPRSMHHIGAYELPQMAEVTAVVLPIFMGVPGALRRKARA